MNECLAVLNKGVDDLILHIRYHDELDLLFENLNKNIKSGEAVDDVIRGFISKTLPSANVNKKKFLYKSSIITTYGLLESYVEALVEWYVKTICTNVRRYSDIPKEISEKHVFNTYELLRSYSRKRDLTSDEFEEAQKKLIRNVHACLNDDDNYVVNESAFSLHSSNFRFDAINKIFSDIGLQNIFSNIAKNEKMKSFIRRDKGWSEESEIDEKVCFEFVKSELDDLAQRRNEIAHGFENEDIQSADYYCNRAGFILVLCDSLFDVVNKNANRIRAQKSPGLGITNPDRYFRVPNVLGFMAGNQLNPDAIGKEIKIGDVGYFESEDNGKGFSFFTVKEIMVQGVKCRELIMTSGAGFTLKIDSVLSTRVTDRTMYLWI